MHNGFLYVTTALIWGSTWLAITFQLGVVAPEVSVAYRFFLAALLIFAYSFWRKLPLRFKVPDHAFMALQGFLLFSINYVMVYIAEQNVPSGLVAVIFSSMIIFNAVFGAILLNRPIRRRTIYSAVVGIGGLGFIFWPEMAVVSLGDASLVGLLLVVVSAVSASLGNIVSARNQENDLPVIQTNAYGMLYGSFFTGLLALARGSSFNFDASFPYAASLLYLALFGSVIAFGSYLTLLGRIGADRAAYVMILFPVIALFLSAVFEGFSMNAFQFAGVGLILVGNFILLARPKQPVLV